MTKQTSFDPTVSLRADSITLGYETKQVSKNLTVNIPAGAFTVIVGPNACGKSTLLRALSRLLKPEAGQVILDGKDIHSYPIKEVAKRLGLLPQTSIAPDGISVAELVSRGRYPHQNLLKRWTKEDDDIVMQAMQSTGVAEFSSRPIHQLSGGQKQRVWVAMVLAQKTPLMLLDEPTTFLDIAHQIDLLDLFSHLNKSQGYTMVAVLHDLNHACRYADHLIAMREGEIIATGHPTDIVNADLVEAVFGLSCLVIDDPVSHTPLVIPKGKAYESPQRSLNK